MTDAVGAAPDRADVAPPAVTPVQRRLCTVAILLVTLMTTLDSSIVNVALPRLSRDLNAPAADTVWVVTAFLLAVACAVPATAAMGDQVGRRRMFLIGVPTFTLASLACALSPTLPVLITARVAQGLGAAMCFAVAIPLFRRLFPPERLGSILGINAMAVAVGTAAGPTLGGIILSALSWPWLFLINIPLGAIAFLLAVMFLPKRAPDRGHFDAAGAVLAAAVIACFLIAVRQLGATSTVWIAVVLFAGAVGGIVLFLRRERRAVRPVIPLPLFTGRFSLAAITAFCSFFGQGIAFVALPFVFQNAYGATPLQSALLFTPWPLVIVVIAPLSGRLADRVSPAILAAVGLLVFAVGLASLALLPAHPATWEVLVRTGVAGLGFGIFQSPNNRDMMAAAPMQYASSAAAVLNLNRTLGQSTGSGVVSVALVIGGAAAGSLAAEAHAASSVLWVAVIGAAAAAVVSAIKLRASIRAARES